MLRLEMVIAEKQIRDSHNNTIDFAAVIAR